MNTTKYFFNQFLSKNQKLMSKPQTGIKAILIFNKLVLLIYFFFFSTTNVNAQKGLFAKFSLGSGYTMEYSNINSSAFSIITKNHAIGWGITDKFAVQIGEFGSLSKQKVGDYNYINIDAFGLGVSYRLPYNIKIATLGAYSMVSFAKKWSEATGEDKKNGFGMNISIDKEWFIAKRWGLRVGPHLFWIKTTDTDYKFFNISLNGSVVFYLTPHK